MTTSTAPTLTKRVGQRVMVSGGRFHGAATITKVNPKNVLITMEVTGQRVNCHPSFLRDLAKDDVAPTRYAEVTAVALPTQNPGDLVRLKGQSGIFVVLADKFDKVNVAKLGGDGGRYYRAPRATVQPLDAADVNDIILAAGA